MLEPGNIVAAITKDCNRKDCLISFGAGMSTLLAWSPAYDRVGNRTDNGDPNTHTQDAHCSTCHRRWTIKTQFGKSTITPSPTAQAESA